MTYKPKIMIATYIPIFNKGMLELLEGILQTFSLLGETEVTIFSFLPSLDISRYASKIRLIDIGKDLHIERLFAGSSNSRLLASFLAGFQHFLFALSYKLLGKNTLLFMKSPIWKEYCTSDALILSTNEDDCVNGPGRFLQLSPVYISLLTKAIRRPTVIYANSTTKTGNTVSIWRLKSRRLWAFLAGFVLNNASLVTVRDKETYDYYRNLTRDKVQIHLTGDPGILMDSVDPRMAQRIITGEKIDRNAGLLIGADITRRLILHSFPEYSKQEDRYENGISEIAKAFDRLCSEQKTIVVFVPHCIGLYNNNDDRVVAHDIVRKMTHKSNVTIITNEYTPQELKGIIGQLDIFVSDRIHALISALAMNVPCCILAYQSDRRPYNLIGTDFKQVRWIFEVDALDGDKLFEVIRNLLYSTKKIRESLPAATKGEKEKALLNGQLLKALLKSVPANSRGIN
jgi:polysaccharide pyruvyl transferase WcaK-like protein